MDWSKYMDLSYDLRAQVIKMLSVAGSGHPAGALGSADFWTLLYGKLLNHRPEDPAWEKRDRLILSAGHYCPIQYAVLAHFGYFSKDELSTLRMVDSRLQGHPVKRFLPGIENSSGPLGQGISVAVGLALSAKRKKQDFRVVCFMGDGEQQEGQVWEAYMSASHYHLDNLLFVIDRNNVQIDGRTEDVMMLEPLNNKLSAFGLQVFEVDGHNMEDIYESWHRSALVRGKPSVMILNTVPGKGVDFMENDYTWHGKVPVASEIARALTSLAKSKNEVNKKRK
jgi:transketolase